MKAAVRVKYGLPDVLSVQDIDTPTPKDNEVLIRVHATTVNRTDWGILTGKPFIIQFFSGLLKPKLQTTGTDFAGEVVSIGKQVSKFKLGDRVWGFNDEGVSSHAEFLTISEQGNISLIASHFSYEQAAASAEGAHYAYNFINKIPLKAGNKVLVIGGTGAIGSSIIQFLKAMDITVTAVCGTNGVDLVKSLGADKVIDYTQEDFTQDTLRYHHVLDAVGKSSFAICKPLLLPKGVYLSSELGNYNQNPFLALITPLFNGKKVVFPIPLNIKRSMDFIQNLIEQHKYTPLIDRKYPLEEIADAYNFVSSGQKLGNVIIKI